MKPKKIDRILEINTDTKKPSDGGGKCGGKTMEKKININVLALPNEMKAMSADLINIDYNNGYVFLNFVQTYGVGDDKGKESSTRNGIVTSRVMLSWEQFTNLLSDMANFAKTTKSKAKEISKKAFEFADNMTITVVDDNDEQQ